MQKNFLSPPEIAAYFIELGKKKASLSWQKQLLLGFMAGAFVALACQGTNEAIHNIGSVGIAKTVAGALFSTALMLVILAGGELFTGNCLMIIALLQKKISLRSMIKSLCFVYLGNFVGSIFIAACIVGSGQLNFSEGMLGAYTIKTALYKSQLGFGNAVVMGVLCNILVCLAVWMAAAASDVTGKILAIFFPIWLFVASGFEHCVANMYYIPAGIFAQASGLWGGDAGLNWGAFLLRNLLPVTLGNLIGGVVFVGIAYWLAYVREK